MGYGGIFLLVVIYLIIYVLKGLGLYGVCMRWGGKGVEDNLSVLWLLWDV